MSTRIGVRVVATSMAFVLCLLAASAVAQVILPKDEVYAGYSWLHPGGHYDFGQATIDHASGIDFSNVYYLPRAHNFGVLLDSSMHFGTDDQNIYYVLGGLQYKYHTDTFSPFVRVFAGPVRQVAPTYIDEWNAAVGGGGGVDLNVWHGSLGGRDPLLAIRLAQVDYIYSNYHPAFAGYGSPQWNSIRLSAGLVVGLGNYYVPGLSASCTATPASVMAGEPVTVTATGSNFNPKHTITYLWATNGGKLSSTSTPSATVDTAGMSAGTYTANATLTDPKGPKNRNVTNCGANFNVNVPHNPPQVTCSASPTKVPAGTPSTITANAVSPDPGVTISGYAYTASAGTITGSGTTATLDTAGAQGGSINVTVTATDSRGLTGNCNTTVMVEAPIPPPQVTPRPPIEFIQRKHQKYIPWRVDNVAKAILDDDASALKNDPNAKIVIVGYADGEPQPMIDTGKNKHAMDLAAQRAVNAKAYLVHEQGIDASRIEVRKGAGKDHLADIFWVPQGTDPATAPLLQGTTPVDESVVTPSENAYPKPKTAAPASHHRKAATAPSQ
jgi:OmpA family